MRTIDEYLRDAENGFISVADVVTRIQDATGVTRQKAAFALCHLFEQDDDFPPFVVWASDGLTELTDMTDAPHRIARALADVAVGKADPEGLLDSAGFDQNKLFPKLEALDARIIAPNPAENRNKDAMEEPITFRIGNRVSTLNKKQYEEYQKAVNARRDQGRYTLEEAADILEKEGGARDGQMLAKLIHAVESGELEAYWPGCTDRYSGEITRDFYEEVRWNDLNAWLKEHEPGISFEFPDPSKSASTGTSKEPKTEQNQANILAGKIETARQKRQDHDMSSERGCRRLILALWDSKIVPLHGENPTYRQIHQQIRIHKDDADELPTLKTVQNKGRELRKEGLIP